LGAKLPLLKKNNNSHNATHARETSQAREARKTQAQNVCYDKAQQSKITRFITSAAPSL
jgi:hypothetical protein